MDKKEITRRDFVKSSAVIVAGASILRPRRATLADTLNEPIQPGPFQPNWDSLKQYRAPEWFRNAKFGMWAHWSPQCVPEDGDWYARNMYIQGSPQYNYHVANYGHPSKFGYKDICHIWTAANWDPEYLIRTYKKAGAKYFVALANHHCNFDCWNSKYQPWNSVNIGPKKDIAGTWAKTAREHGLRFGVTVHCARTWKWFNVSHGSDKTGPLKGVPYDGNMTKAEGGGKWWNGYDPWDLYCPPHPDSEEPSMAYIQKWFNRTKDLLDQHDPDLLYFDDRMLPLGDTGLRIAAHFYNANIQRHGGKLEAVLNTKIMPPDLRGTLVWDIERGRTNQIEEFAWQTDTCIGDWHYKRDIQYKTAAMVAPMLVDIVSKNGNLLLNIPVRGDGTIDDREVSFITDFTKWMGVNEEAIFNTRPWKIFGEGPTRLQGGSFDEDKAKSYTPQDIRFTTKGDTLYAIALGWPEDGKLTIKSLASNSPHYPGEVTRIGLLGSDGNLKWKRDENGLTFQLPERKPCDYAYAFAIQPLKA